jgi:hypothetical protein
MTAGQAGEKEMIGAHRAPLQERNVLRRHDGSVSGCSVAAVYDRRAELSAPHFTFVTL